MNPLPLRIVRPLLIRSARLSDAEALHHACFPSQSREQLTDYLQWCLGSDTRPTRLVALDGDTIVGHAELTAHCHTTIWGEISSLVVTAERRGEGIGRRLVGAAQRVARRWVCTELRLQVSARAPELIRLYEGWGFASRGLPINHLLWMSLPLSLQSVEAAKVVVPPLPVGVDGST